MRSIKTFGLAVALIGVMSLSAQGAIVTQANGSKTSIKGVKTSTAGQGQILLTIDPFNVAEFSLSVDFEAGKVQFDHVFGINGYIVDTFSHDPTGGFLNNIHGYFPGFNSNEVITFGPANGPLGGGPVSPPPGEIDIFTVVFNIIDPNAAFFDFTVFAGPGDYIRGFDPSNGTFTMASGPFNPQTGTGVQPASVTILNGAGGPAVPLPPAMIAGAALGAWVLGKRKRAA